jgi:heat shock protein HslJ
MIKTGIRMAVVLALLAGAGCQPQPPADGYRMVREAPKPLEETVWKLDQIGPGHWEGAPIVVSPESQVGFVIFAADGRTLTGYAGCQPVTGQYRREGDTLRIEAVEATGGRCTT